MIKEFLSVILVFFLVIFQFKGMAQAPKRILQIDSLRYVKYFELKSHKGGYLYSGETLDEVLEKGYWSVDLRYGLQSTGKTFWDRLYRYPRYGLGLYFADLKSPRILGNPTGLYGFINIPLTQHYRWAMSYDMALGMSYDFKQYNSDSNPLNDAIGSDVNVFASFGMRAEVYLTKHTELIFGVDYTHFSNGRTTTPNSGLNLVGTILGVRYSFNPLSLALLKRLTKKRLGLRRPKFQEELPLFVPHWGWNVFVGGGRVATYGNHEVDSHRYSNFSFTVDAMRHYSHKYSVGVGVDLFYDGSLSIYYPGEEASLGEKIMVGTHIAHHWHFYDFTMMTQLATYLYKDTPSRGRFYARVGFQYNFTSRWYGQISLKTQNGTKSDFIEWGIGIRMGNRERGGRVK